MCVAAIAIELCIQSRSGVPAQGASHGLGGTGSVGDQGLPAGLARHDVGALWAAAVHVAAVLQADGTLGLAEAHQGRTLGTRRGVVRIAVAAQRRARGERLGVRGHDGIAGEVQRLHDILLAQDLVVSMVAVHAAEAQERAFAARGAPDLDGHDAALGAAPLARTCCNINQRQRRQHSGRRHDKEGLQLRVGDAPHVLRLHASQHSLLKQMEVQSVRGGHDSSDSGVHSKQDWDKRECYGEYNTLSPKTLAAALFEGHFGGVLSECPMRRLGPHAGFYTPHAWCSPQRTMGYSYCSDHSFSFSLGIESMVVEGLYNSTVMRASIGPCYRLFTVNLQDQLLSAHIAVCGEGFESCYFEDAPFSLQHLEVWYMGV